jgi:hypothetical protein
MQTVSFLVKFNGSFLLIEAKQQYKQEDQSCIA